MININFLRLFTVEILNQYYSDGVCNDFVITPSARTASLMSGYKLVSRQYGNRLYVGIAADTTGIPALVPDEGAQLVFFMKCINPLFFNFTKSPAGLAGDVLYFTNKNNNAIVNGSLFLTAPIPAYVSGSSYHAGDLVASGGTVFEAAKENPGTDFTDFTNWINAGANRYVTGADIKHSQKDPVQQAADPADLSHFIPGADYAELLRANDTCAVLNIVNDSTLANGYNLLTGGKATVPPAQKLFTICFLNRALKWTYVLLPLSSGAIAPIPPVTGTPAFPGATVPPNRFTSAYPLRFSNGPQSYAFQLTTADGQTVKPLPQASPDIIRQDTTSHELYAEIYLNY